MKLKEFFLKSLRKIINMLAGSPKDSAIDESRVQYSDNDANGFIYRQISESIQQNRGFALCKLGTAELGMIVSRMMQGKWIFDDYKKYLRGYPVPLFYDKQIRDMGNNAGLFPATREMAEQFDDLMLEDIKEIDILASYAWKERYIETLIAHCTKVNLDGYYAPFLFEHPWTRVLEGKRVLIVHPFADSIKQQYAKRIVLFDNPEVLPEFASLRVVKAVQTQAGSRCEFADWFAALNHMKQEMEKEDFDIALIGCGAYGLPLTVHAKRLGKIGIHLAGWTQMLFGIYGKRWLTDQPQYARFIKDSWVRPSGDEVISGARKVEGGCYW